MTDCLMVGADWVKVYRDVDPAAAWRGRYDSEEGCLAMLREAGGIVRIVSQGLRSVGITQRTRRPRAGDFALVKLPGPSAIVAGAICLPNEQFVVMTKDVGAVSTADPALLKAWKIV